MSLLLKYIQISKKYWYLILVFILGFGIRIYQIAQVPPGLQWDEAALGYNAFSILQTGRDEHGVFLPPVFKSFGDFKPGLGVYLMVPSILIFGLSEFAVRLPAVIFGAISAIVLFFLVKKLFDNQLTAILAAVSFTISPWSIILSRPAFEAHIALFFLLLGILFFLYAKEKGYLLPVSAGSFLLALYTYQTAKFTVPLFIVALLLIFRREIFKISKKWFVISFLILLLSFPLYLGFLTGQGGRFEVKSFFSYPRSPEETVQIGSEDNLPPSDFQFQLWHGDWIYFTRGVLSRYLHHFSPSFLFFEGDINQNPKHAVPVGGVLYYFDLLLLPLGFHFLTRFKNTQTKLLLFFWLILGPIPAAITRDETQAVRALTLLPALQILIGLGAYQIFKSLGGQILGKIALVCLSAFILWNVFFFLDQYFVHLPKKLSAEWLSAQKEMSLFLEANASKYDRVIVSDKFGQPYIFYLFYAKYDPKNYQKQNSFVPNPGGDVGSVPRIDNISFRQLYWPKDRGERRTLFIGTEYELPPKDIEPFEEFRILEEFHFKNTKQLAYRVVDSR